MGKLKIVVGSALISAGLHFFWAPSQVAGGGVSGLSIVIKELLPMIPISFIILVLNAIMFLLGFIVLGKEFGIKSIFSSLLISIIMRIFEVVIPVVEPLTSDMLMSLIFGSLIMGLGQSIIFIQEGSSGGTDIIAKIISRFTPLKIGVSLMLADMVVVIMATFILGIEKGLYAMLGVIITSLLIDFFIAGISIEKYVMIIPSDKGFSKTIQQFILNELERGATLYEATGAYSGERKTVITTAVDRREFLKLRLFLQNTDNRAFVSVQDLHEVLGEGFKEDIAKT